MQIRFPHLLITARLGSLSAQLSLRADPAEPDSDGLVVDVPSPRAKQEAALQPTEDEARPAKTVA